MVINIYTDGSWFKGEPFKTYGGVVLVSEKDEVISLRRCWSSKDFLVSGRNHGGELLAAMYGIQEGLYRLNSKEGRLVVYHDYKGVSAFVDEWVPKSTWKKSSRLYHNIVLQHRKDNPNAVIEFRKVPAHSGNKWNDVADSVANGHIPSIYKDRVLADVEF